MPWKAVGLHVLDVLLCVFLFFPSMVCFWRGIWDLLGVYLLPGRVPLNHWMTTLIGSLTVFGYFFLPSANNFFSARRHTNPVFYVIGTRACLIIYSFFNMALWRGLWSLGDYYLGSNLEVAIVGLVCGYGLLIMFRSSRTVVFSPMAVVLDTRDNALLPCTRFHVQPKATVKYVADALFTQLVLLGLTIYSWRNLWCIFDAFWFPDRKLFADVVALIVGMTGCLLLLSLEVPLTALSTKLARKNFYMRLAFEDLCVALTFVVLMFTWRGGWNLNSAYMISDLLIGGWVNFAFGTAALLTLQLYSYAGACGCCIDCYNKMEVTPIWDSRYMRHYARQWISDTRVYSVENNAAAANSNNIINKKEEVFTTSAYTININNENLAGHLNGAMVTYSAAV